MSVLWVWTYEDCQFMTTVFIWNLQPVLELGVAVNVSQNRGYLSNFCSSSDSDKSLFEGLMFFWVQKPSPGAFAHHQISLHSQYRSVSTVIQSTWVRSPTLWSYCKSLPTSHLSIRNFYQWNCEEWLRLESSTIFGLVEIL